MQIYSVWDGWLVHNKMRTPSKINVGGALSTNVQAISFCVYVLKHGSFLIYNGLSLLRHRQQTHTHSLTFKMKMNMENQMCMSTPTNSKKKPYPNPDGKSKHSYAIHSGE